MPNAYPMGESLDQQLAWAEKKLRPWMRNKRISYWVENSRHWEIAQKTMDFLVRAVRNSRELNKR